MRLRICNNAAAEPLLFDDLHLAHRQLNLRFDLQQLRRAVSLDACKICRSSNDATSNPYSRGQVSCWQRLGLRCSRCEAWPRIAGASGTATDERRLIAADRREAARRKRAAERCVRQVERYETDKRRPLWGRSKRRDSGIAATQCLLPAATSTTSCSSNVRSGLAASTGH